jgi:protein phosphatase
VGDSRAYLFNANGVTEDGAKIMQMTSDHSLVARLVDIGQLTPEEARVHPQRNVIYRALGHHPTVDVDTSSQPISPGDRLLLCSDGLTAHLADEALERTVLAYTQPEHICRRLIDQANALGGLDNISVVLAVVAGAGE